MKLKYQVTLCAMTLCVLAAASGCQSLTNVRDKAGDVLGLNSNGPKKRKIDSDEFLDPLGARDGDRLLLDDLAPSQLATTWKTRYGGGNGRNSERARKYYDSGEAIYNKGLQQLDSDPSANLHQAIFTEAANKFRLASAAWSGSAVEEDALYFEGESYFFADRYVQSNRAFEKLISEYAGTKACGHGGKSPLRHRVVLVTALRKRRCDQLQRPQRDPGTGLAKEARRVLHQIRMDDPTGPAGGRRGDVTGQSIS